MSTTDIRIFYPEGTTDTNAFADKIEILLHDAGVMNPPRVSDMPGHLTITIATGDLFEAATALRDAKLL